MFYLICKFIRWILIILALIDWLHNPGITDTNWGPLLFLGLSWLFEFIGSFGDELEMPSTADEIEKYAGLRDKGIITEEEFQSKKRKLLK